MRFGRQSPGAFSSMGNSADPERRHIYDALFALDQAFSILPSSPVSKDSEIDGELGALQNSKGVSPTTLVDSEEARMYGTEGVPGSDTSGQSKNIFRTLMLLVPLTNATAVICSVASARAELRSRSLSFRWTQTSVLSIAAIFGRIRMARSARWFCVDKPITALSLTHEGKSPCNARSSQRTSNRGDAS